MWEVEESVNLSKISNHVPKLWHSKPDKKQIKRSDDKTR